jgi:hypothetical protein
MKSNLLQLTDGKILTKVSLFLFMLLFPLFLQGSFNAVAQTPLPTPQPEDVTQPLPTEESMTETDVRLAMEATIQAHYEALGLESNYSLTDITIDGQWASGKAILRFQDVYGEMVSYLLAQRLPNGAWQALLPDGSENDELYNHWLNHVPQEILPVNLADETYLGIGETTAISQYEQSLVETAAEQVVEFHHELFQWAPDQNLMLYRSINDIFSGPGTSPYDLWLYDAEADNSQLIAAGGQVWRPSFTNDGSLIQFWQDWTPYQTPVDNIDPRPVQTDKPLSKGVFSPDGLLLLYITTDGEVLIQEIQTGQEMLLGDISNLGDRNNLWPEWSTDGEQIAMIIGGKAYSLPANAASVDELAYLGDVQEPEGSTSADYQYLIWGESGSCLNAYTGETFFLDGSLASCFTEDATYSFDGRFGANIRGGEIFVINDSMGMSQQVTNNQELIDTLLIEQTQTIELPTAIAAVADGFDFPVGIPDGSGYRNGNDLITGDDGWGFNHWTGSVYHPGEDWNGLGGRDTDLGDPVHAIANGVVVESAWDAPSWGNIILIEHTLPDGSKVWSQYAHLQDRLVSKGNEVSRGQQIGTIGKGDPVYNYYAHLHFEIRINYLPFDAWPIGWSQNQVLEYYTHPTNFINANRQISGGSNCSNYSHNGVVLFDAQQCGGSELKYSSATGLINLPDVGWNDRARSIHVQSGWSVMTYQHGGGDGDRRCINWSMWDLTQDQFDGGTQMDREISSIQVFNNTTCSGGSGQVRLFSQSNYGGSILFNGGTGFSNNPNANSYSMEIPSGWSVKTWRGDNRSGEERCWSSSVSNLQDHGWQLAIQSIEVFSSDVCQTTTCNPNSDQVAFYVDANYGGECVVKGVGDYANPASIGLPNDAISSIRVGANVEATLCRDDNYSGTCDTFTSDDSNLGDNSIGDNQVSSARVQTRDNGYTVSLYNDSNYGGVECYIVDAGWANVCDGYNDQASSIRVRSGWSARVWEHNDRVGASRCFTGDNANFSGLNFNENGSGSLDNAISSFAAYNQSSCPPLIPDMPSNVTVSSVTQNSITLSWQDNSNNETGFNIYDWNGEAFVYLASVGANVTTFTDTNLNCGATYFYEVSAYNNSGESPNTSWVSGTTSSCPTVGPLQSTGYIIYDNNVGNSSGNDNNVVNCGETIELYVRVSNQGAADATGVNASISTPTAGIGWLFNTSSDYPDILGGSFSYNSGDFDFTVARNVPDGRQITFNLNITAENGGPWTDNFTVPVVCKKGTDTVGIFAPDSSAFYLRNRNLGGAADITALYGPRSSGWIPLAGDWDGNGTDTIGLYVPAQGMFYLRNINAGGNADISARYGPANANWIPIVGDWDGNGTDTVGLYVPAQGMFYLRNTNTGGYADISVRYGPMNANWAPVVGDWDGNGTDTVGLYVPESGLFYLRNSNTGGIANISVRYGPRNSSWLPVIGDWDGNGTDTVGLYAPELGYYFLRNSNSGGVADLSVRYGPRPSSWIPLVGDWNGE